MRTKSSSNRAGFRDDQRSPAGIQCPRPVFRPHAGLNVGTGQFVEFQPDLWVKRMRTGTRFWESDRRSRFERRRPRESRDGDLRLRRWPSAPIPSHAAPVGRVRERSIPPASVEPSVPHGQTTAPHFMLQLFDLRGQRRLGNRQPLGRFRKMQRIGDGEKISKMAKFHGLFIS